MRLRSGVAVAVMQDSGYAQNGPQAWEPPYAAGAALKKRPAKKKKKKKKKKKERNTPAVR